MTSEVRSADRVAFPETSDDPLWCLVIEGFDPLVERTREALLALANGTIGVGGATMAEHDHGARRWTLVNGVYDGEGPGSQLLAGPVGLHLNARVEEGAALRRALDLRSGIVDEELAAGQGSLRTRRFVSMADPWLVAMRAAVPEERPIPSLLASTGGTVLAQGADDGVAWMSTAAPDGIGGIAAAVLQVDRHTHGVVVCDRLIAYDAQPRGPADPAAAVRRARDAAEQGFDRLLAEHRAAWSKRWEDADIAIEGDDDLQLAVRFALFHLMASVAETGEAAVGARGLTGDGYRGHVFWDADTFTLPFLAATRPAAARAMLAYRLARLPAAQAIARGRNRSGARFPWESARSGREVTPPFARDRSGRVVPIRTGQQEEHIVAQVPWAAACYAAWSGDVEFERGAGTELFVESARYWRSRVRRDRDGTAHIYGVVGPDEYHEPVDDNAFTNMIARWVLRRAAELVECAPAGASNVTAEEVQEWREVAAGLVDGYDHNTGIYEQFAGFHRLEALLIAEVAPRRPIAADVLLGADRVRGAQVLKQADVLMLHHLLPDQVVPGSLEPNLRYYEPRTAHGSSLSPAIHAALFARVRDYERAVAALRLAARIDLDDLTGSSAAGMHIATMGGLWQALVFGFAGVRAAEDGLEIDPRLPPSWGALDVRVRFRGSRVHVHITRDRVGVTAEPSVDVLIGAGVHLAEPTGLQLRRRGTDWEVP